MKRIDVMSPNMTIVNSLTECKGVITRERTAGGKIEKSVIDYIVICDGMREYLKEMFIDDERAHVLTKYTKKGKTISDHNILFGRFNMTFNRQMTKLSIEMFDFENRENQKTFLDETKATNNLSSSFRQGRSFLHNSNIFLKNLIIPSTLALRR